MKSPSLLALPCVLLTALSSSVVAQTTTCTTGYGVINCTTWAPLRSHNNVGEALQNGANFAQSLTENARKTRAYNALRKQYGDIAGDPDAALKLQQYDNLRKQQQPEFAHPEPGRPQCTFTSGTTIDCH